MSKKLNHFHVQHLHLVVQGFPEVSRIGRYPTVVIYIKFSIFAILSTTNPLTISITAEISGFIYLVDIINKTPLCN